MFSKTTAAKIVLVAIVGSSIALPLVASAAYSTPNLWGNPPGFWGPLVSCTGNYLSGDTGSQCKSLCDLINTAVNIVYFLISVALFIIAPLSVAVGGIMIMLAGANPGMLESGKKVLTGAVIGVIIVLCAYLVIATILSVLNITAIGGFGGATCTPD